MVLVAAPALLAGCVAKGPTRSDFASASAHAGAPLPDGSWTGRPATSRPYVRDILQDDLELHARLQGGTARVHVLAGGRWTEAMPGTFRVMRQGPSAILAAIERDVSWTGARMVSLAVHGEDALPGARSRTVRNLAPDAQDRVSGSGAVGLLRRAPALPEDVESGWKGTGEVAPAPRH